MTYGRTEKGKKQQHKVSINTEHFKNFQTIYLKLAERF